MRDEIERVLEMVKSGAVTSAQGAELIAALKETLAPDAPPAAEAASAAKAAPAEEPKSTRTDEAGASRRDETSWSSRGREEAPSERESRRRHRHRRHRHHRVFHGGQDFGEVFDHLGDDIERAVGVGARTLKWALKSGLHLSGAAWEGDSNSAILSRAEAPTGQDYTCTDNHLAVSHIRGLRLERSTFSGNELNAASIFDVELEESTVSGLQLHGSSIKTALIERSELRDSELNGARLSGLTLGNAKLLGCSFNGAQVRDFGVSGSSVESCRMNGVKLKDCIVRADSRIKGLDLSGVLGRNWLLEDAVFADSKFAGVRVDGLIVKHGGFEGVRFSRSTWVEPLDAHALGLMRDVEFERVILKRCTFEDCRFDGTRFEGFEAADLHFREVDFSGQVITSAEALARLARERDVA